jgi:hypothetical protein
MRNGGGTAMTAGAITNEPGSGRFIESRGLTEKQRAFVSAYLENGGKQTDAARRAGYAEPLSSAWQLLRNRAVLAAIHDETIQRVATGGAIGVGVLVEVAQDRAAPPAARVSAAKWLAEAAGHGLAARKAGELADDDVPLEARSLGELEQMAADLAAQLRQAREGIIEGEARNVAPDDASDPMAIPYESNT